MMNFSAPVNHNLLRRKTRLQGAVQHPYVPFTHQGKSHIQANLVQVLCEGKSCVLLKTAAEIVFLKTDSRGDLFQGDRLLIVTGYIPDRCFGILAAVRLLLFVYTTVPE